MILLILGILMFIGLVVIHEFGHFIMAKRSGVDVEEFGIGFPPKIWGRKTKGGWLFSINLLPIGGFVRLKGEHDADTTKGAYGAASLWNKSRIMAAGVVMNLLTAFFLLTILAWIGMPQLVDNQFTVKSDTKVIPAKTLIDDIEKNSPAAQAGLKDGDQILAVGPKDHETQLVATQDLHTATTKYAGQKVDLTYKRGNQTKQVSVTLRTKSEVDASLKTKNQKGYLGVVTDAAQISKQRSTWSAPVVAVGLTGQFTSLTFQGLGKALAGLGSTIAGIATQNKAARQAGQTEASSQVSGPVGIFFVLKEGGILGFQFTLLIIAIISLTLAIMNILPIPALDGGRLWLTLFTHAIKKPLSQEKEELINGIGFAVLMGLVLLITVVDVKRFF
jgi:regulator of sigma E protease